jgi:CubicO group peptidase (beta-lactamase class C family)
MTTSQPTPRALPGRPSLRHLKLEAKRRLAAGEFAALNEAQLAIAREHGQPSWAALKQLAGGEPAGEGPALAQLRWIVSQFGGADSPAWVPPEESELRQHCTGRFLDAIPPARLTADLAGWAARFREELTVARDSLVIAQVQIAGLQVTASVEAEAPHRIGGLRFELLGSRVTDTRAAGPPTSASGEVPAAAAEAAEAGIAELGLVGLVLAGCGPGGASWAAARGWADLERAEALETGQPFPAYDVTKLITATAVLRLVAAGQVGLDEPANARLRSVRLADDAVTVRDLLLHTGGVDSSFKLFADAVPELNALAGPVLACTGARGEFRYSQGGYAALGQLIADVTGSAYGAAAERLVLEPLGMSESSFPAAWPGAAGITGYNLAADGSFVAAPRLVCTVPAAGGMWTTAADLARFGRSWSSLLPGPLAREAVRPQAAAWPSGAKSGLGWVVNERRGLIGHPGDGPGAGASLAIRRSSGRTQVALANRRIPIEPVNLRVLDALG